MLHEWRDFRARPLRWVEKLPKGKLRPRVGGSLLVWRMLKNSMAQAYPLLGKTTLALLANLHGTDARAR